MSAQVSITQLPAAGAITGTEAVPIVQNGVTVQTTTGAISASPSQTYQYLTVIQTPQLPNSRYFGATNGLSITDGGAQGLFNVSTTGALLSLVNSGTGFQVKTSSTAITGRSIAVTGSGLSIADGDGIAGNPTVALAGQVLSLANLSANGLMTITTGGVLNATYIQGTANQIGVADGTGVSGYPTVSIVDNPVLPGTGSVTLPSGATASRPGVPSNGMLRYNTDTALLEAYLNSTWTSLASGSGVTSISTGTGLTGGPITSVGTISLANTAVTAGSYTTANITVNAQGQITSASNGAGGVTSFSAGSTGLTPSTATTGAIVLAGTLIPENGGTGAVTLTGYVYGNGTSTMTASATIPTTALSGTVTNAQLANSSLTIGTTAISLGTSSLTLGGLTSVAVTQDPVSALQLATKQYVDAVAEGLHIHAACDAATTGTLASITGGTVTYNNGTSGVGATLTLSVALTTLDGVTLTNGMRLLIKNEVATANNGIYTWATGGTVLTRATDFDNNVEIASGDFVFITYGTIYGSTGWVQTLPVTVVGTSPIVWTQFSGTGSYTAGTGLTLTGTQFSLTSPVTTALGGTGVTTAPTAGAIVYGATTSTLGYTSAGTSGQPLLSGGASTPTFGTLSVGGGGTGVATLAGLAYGNGTSAFTAASAAQVVAVISTTAVTNATNAANMAVATNSTNSTNYLTFVNATTGNLAELVNSSITCNPSTGAITGGISGGTF